MEYYQDSSVIRSRFVYLVLGLKKASPRNSTKVKVEPAGFSQQITRKVSDLTYSLSGAAFRFVYLVLGLKKASPRNSTKVNVEPAGFSQQITRKVSDFTYSLSGAASGVSPYSFCLLLFREAGGGGEYQRCRRTITVFVTVFDET